MLGLDDDDDDDDDDACNGLDSTSICSNSISAIDSGSFSDSDEDEDERTRMRAVSDFSINWN